MKYAMEDSSFEEASRERKKPPRHKKQKGARGNPEGDSLLQKDTVKLKAPPNSDNDSSFEVTSPRKRKKNKAEQDNLVYIEQRHLAKKSKSMYSDTDLSSLDVTDTPDTLSQISAIAPVSDVSMMTTFSRMRNPKGRHDVTWERAVQKARGQPDGAEKSFSRKKSSKVMMRSQIEVIREVAEGGESDKSTENIPPASNRSESPEPEKLERRKSIKVWPDIAKVFTT